MKQKYVLVKRKDAQEVLIREYVELEKEQFAFICEEKYRMDDLQAAAKNDIPSLVAYLRRPNMYPKQDYAEKIAQTAMELLSPENDASVLEIVFDDVEAFEPRENLVDDRLTLGGGEGRIEGNG